MHVDKSPGTPFPLRNLGRAFFAPWLMIALSSCAPVRGALAGAVGGVPYVDEVRHKEAEPGAIHSELKVLGHDVVVVCLAYGLWPLAVAYGGASAIYGAYQFMSGDMSDSLGEAHYRTSEQKANTEKIKEQNYSSPTPLGSYNPADTK